MKYLFTILSFTASVFLLSPPATAQTGGTVAGKVSDKVSGQPLIGVTVLLGDGTMGTVTDVAGSYRLTGIAAGTYTVTFKYLGYQPKSVTGVTVASGKSTELSSVLDKSASTRLDEVVITSSYQQESLNALYAERKRSSVITDGISRDQIQRSPDNNTAEVLQRISGTTIQDDKFVIVRGLAARYNNTMMNGAVMPATEPDKKAFSFNVIPSSLIDNMVLYKTASADLPGDASGATIRVNTKDMPDRKLMSLSVKTGYNTLTTFRDFSVGHGAGRYDFLGFDDGSRALPGTFKAVQSGYGSLTTADKIAVTRQFPNTFGGERAGESLPPLSFQFAAGNTYQLKKGNRLGIVAALNYSTARKTSSGAEDQYLLSKEHQYHYTDSRYGKNYHTGALLNAAYSFGASKVSWKNFFTNEFSTSFTQRTGQVFDGTDNTKNIFSLNNETTQNGLVNSVLSGQHALPGRGIHLDWDLAYGRSYRLQPDQRILTLTQSNPGEDYYLFLSNENSPAIRDAGRVYSRLHENIYSGNLNATVPLRYFNRDQKLKLGVSRVYRDRSFSTQALGYASDLDPYGRGATITLDESMALSDIFTPQNLEAYRILLANIPQNTKDYTGTAAVNAAYVMVDNYLADRWRLAAGIRVEDYRQRLVSLNQPTQQYHYTDILPSVNLTWSVTEKTNVRLAYSRTLNRPEFRELAAFRYYDYSHSFIVSGNPELRRSISNNADWRIAYYPSAGEIMSATVFYKYFHNPIEQVNQGNNVMSYHNADNAVDYGIELEARKKLGFLGASALTKNLVVHANASVIRSRIAFDGQAYQSVLQGQSPYSLNAGLDYAPTSDGFSVSVLYNRIGPRLAFRGEQEGLDTYEKPRDVLDFQLSRKVLKKAGEVRFSVSDILARPVVLYYRYGGGSKSGYEAGRDKVISTIRTGTTFSFSFTYSFFQ